MTSRCDAARCRPTQDAVVPDYLEVLVTKKPVPDGPHRVDAKDPQEARIADLQRRVRDGSYDNRSTMDHVARRILELGDL